MNLNVLYFAALAEAAGRDGETISTRAADLRALYAERAAEHGFDWPVEHLRVALDGAFVSWDSPPRDGAEVVFIPPVSGG